MSPSPPITDAQLMAYADGELAGAERDAVAQALAANATLAQRLAEQQHLRHRLHAAFADELDEPVPERLLRAVAEVPARPAPVVSSAERQAAGEAANATHFAARWAAWGGLAASVAIGVLIGHVMWPSDDGGAGFALQRGRLVAQGDVKAMLSTQTVAQAGPDAAMRPHFSFVDQQGRYCRTFSGQGTAGVACRDGDDWTVPLLVDSPAAAASTGLRQAASALPAAVLAEVDRRIDGPPLDAAAEQQALRRGWRR